MRLKDTKYESINKTLAAVGKEVFIDFYYDFKLKRLKHSQLAEKIYKENQRSTSRNQNRRIYRAFHIFNINAEREALELVINSPKISDRIRTRAREILKEETCLSYAVKDIKFEQTFLRDFNLKFASKEKYQNSGIQEPKAKKDCTYGIYDRSAKEAKKAIEGAGFLCELSPEHPSFIRKDGVAKYTEPHHLIPLAASSHFPGVNLDRAQNIISLCSNCHNKLHYGRDIEWDLTKLFEKRKDLLKLIGINITYEELLDYYK